MTEDCANDFYLRQISKQVDRELRNE